MPVPRARSLLLVGLAALLAALPAAAAPQAPKAQNLTVADSRTGTGPCGFAVQRDINGTVAVTPSLDDAGILMLVIDRVDLRGRFVNPANGKSVALTQVKRNGKVSLGADGATTAVALALTGHVFPGYEDARIELALGQSVAGAADFAFAPDEHAEETWGRVCELLS
ncbi:MAG: hypothetical protein M3Q71_11555 [Chloroflexota bacterium]|nr:hypothetical protein [Chloroflexota bacterium]MDP9471284.1 hypothetical protein [Chloroflexota bacterium]